MTATTDQRAIDLMPQLRDILHLPEDLDLPRLYSIDCYATCASPGWTVKAHLWHSADERTWEELSVYAQHVGGRVELGEAYGPEGDRQREGAVLVSVAGVVVRVWGALSEGFIPPAPEPEPLHAVDGEDGPGDPAAEQADATRDMDLADQLIGGGR